jgi:hypothetical protein
MGGLFSAPKPVVLPPPAPPAAIAPPPPAPALAAETARVESRSRSRGGLAGTIATSATGVLGTLPVARKSLLGE